MNETGFGKGRRHAEIAGGGIAGLATAIGLASRGWSVRVHERSNTLRPEGAGIYIWENGLRVLEALGALKMTLEGSHAGRRRETRDDRNRLIAAADWESDPGRRVVSVARNRLLGALSERAKALGATLSCDSDVVGALPEGVLLLRDGTQLKANLIVAADGINSKVRDSLGLLDWRRPMIDGAIRVMIPRLLHERDSAEGQMYVEYWSGHRRILYTPCSDEEVYLALTTLDTDVEGKAVPLNKTSWCASFPHLRSLIDRIPDSGRWDRFETVSLKKWSAGCVAIVGDAAHAQAPNLGQGGGCSLMNALSLSVSLDEQGTIDQCLERWELLERPLTNHTQRVSALYGQVTRMPAVLRGAVLGWAGRSRWAMAQRMRTAHHEPTGTKKTT